MRPQVHHEKTLERFSVGAIGHGGELKQRGVRSWSGGHRPPASEIIDHPFTQVNGVEIYVERCIAPGRD